MLTPDVLRELLFRLAKAGLFAPRWSARIEEEWRRAAAKRRGDGGASTGDIALARAAFPDALVAGWEPIEETLSLPDWNDRHVLAAAIQAKADLLLTDNLRDFPRRALAGRGLTREAADPFLWGLVGGHSDAVGEIAFRMAAESGAPDAAALFKRARLPRFAKALSRL